MTTSAIPFTPTLADYDVWGAQYAEILISIDAGKWNAGHMICNAVKSQYPDYYDSSKRYPKVAEFIREISRVARRVPLTARRYAWTSHLFEDDYSLDVDFDVYRVCAHTEKRGDDATRGFAKRWLAAYEDNAWSRTELNAYIAATEGDPTLIDKVDPDGKPKPETLIRTKPARVMAIDGGLVTFDFMEIIELLQTGQDVVLTCVSSEVYKCED